MKASTCCVLGKSEKLIVSDVAVLKAPTIAGVPKRNSPIIASVPRRNALVENINSPRVWVLTNT